MSTVVSNIFDHVDMLDEKFAKFEHSLRNDIVNLRNDLNSVRKNGIEDSQKFTEKEFEEQNRIKGLYQCQGGNQIEINKLAQYNRSFLC